MAMGMENASALCSGVVKGPAVSAAGSGASASAAAPNANSVKLAATARSPCAHITELAPQ
jgi:hypothetical protein